MSPTRGLVELYLPATPQHAVLDLIFIHGLHGDARKTWTYKSVCWPQDLLRKDIPRARILSFGYDANITHFWSRPLKGNKLDVFSDDFFQSLNDYRYNTGTRGRPIILVAHSMGGLVCANALVDAASGLENLQDVALSIRRIAFIGTPLRGSDKAEWADTARSFLKLFKTTNSELTKDLKYKSEKLAKLGDQFPTLLMSRSKNPTTMIDVHCFYEGKPLRKGLFDFGVIVSKSSATLSGCPKTLLEADHESMVKFKDSENINYIRVVGVLRRWAKELRVNETPVPVQPVSVWFQPTPTRPAVERPPLELYGSEPRHGPSERITQSNVSESQQSEMMDVQEPLGNAHRFHRQQNTDLDETEDGEAPLPREMRSVQQRSFPDNDENYTPRQPMRERRRQSRREVPSISSNPVIPEEQSVFDERDGYYTINKKLLGSRPQKLREESAPLKPRRPEPTVESDEGDEYYAQGQPARNAGRQNARRDVSTTSSSEESDSSLPDRRAQAPPTRRSRPIVPLAQDYNTLPYYNHSMPTPLLPISNQYSQPTPVAQSTFSGTSYGMQIGHNTGTINFSPQYQGEA